MSESAISEETASFEEICEFNRRGLFVGGSAKSGTTLLQSLLDGHPRLSVLPEQTSFFTRLSGFSDLHDYRAKARWLLEKTNLRLLAPDGVESARETGEGDPRDYTNFDYPHFVRLTEEFAKRPGLNDSLIFSEVARVYAIAKGCDWRSCIRWVEKTPGNEVYSDDIFKLYPEAKLLQIVRDPRAVFASRKKRLIERFGGHAKAHRLVREWNQSSRHIRKLQNLTHSYLLVCYEDLVLDSERIFEKISKFVGIELLPVMLEPTRAGKHWGGNSAYDKTFGGISSHSIDQWKKQLTDDEIWWIEMHCQEGMKIAGYPLDTDCKFSLSRWSRRMSGESWGGYIRARRGSLCQWAGLLEDCRYDVAPN